MLYQQQVSQSPRCKISCQGLCVFPPMLIRKIWELDFGHPSISCCNFQMDVVIQIRVCKLDFGHPRILRCNFWNECPHSYSRFSEIVEFSSRWSSISNFTQKTSVLPSRSFIWQHDIHFKVQRDFCPCTFPPILIPVQKHLGNWKYSSFPVQLSIHVLGGGDWRAVLAVLPVSARVPLPPWR